MSTSNKKKCHVNQCHVVDHFKTKLYAQYTQTQWIKDKGII